MESVTTQTDLLSAALSYAKLGWKVFPLAEGTKIPRKGSGGVNDATTDPDQIRKWFDGNNYNIGIAAGCVGLVLDVDVKNGHNGPQSLAALESVHGPLPTTIYQTTPSGGLQYLFTLPKGATVKNSDSEIGDGLDIKTAGGYFVAPPSFVRRSPAYDYEGSYEWIIQQSPFELAVAEIPAWLLDLVNKPKHSEPTSPDTVFKNGTRNSSLSSLAGTMRRRGMAKEAIIAALIAENKLKCQPPLSESEVLQIAESISRYRPEEPPKEGPQESAFFSTFPLASARDFWNVDYPPIEFLAEPFVQKNGRTVLSGPPGVCKTIYAMNLAGELAQENPGIFLTKFTLKPCRVLFIDLENGPITIQQRFKKMFSTPPPNLYVCGFASFNLLDEGCRAELRRIVSETNPDIVFLDPLSSLIHSNLFTQEEVSPLKEYFDIMRAELNVTLFFIHHWKKGTQHAKSGPEMLAGSFALNAWLENQLSLSLNRGILTLRSEKSRGRHFKPMGLTFDEETFRLKFVQSFEEKYGEADIEKAFDELGKTSLTKDELEAFCKANNGPKSWKTIRDKIEKSNRFVITPSDTRGVKTTISRKAAQQEAFLDEAVEINWNE